MIITLTTLCENTAVAPGFFSEWGWSVLIDIDGEKILLDTGAGRSAISNADKMGINLSSIQKIVLSHAHADHTGGLRDMLVRTGEVEVMAHPAIWDKKCKIIKEGSPPVYNGVPFAREELEKAASFTLSSEPAEVSKYVITTGEVPMTTSFEKPEPNFMVMKDGSLTKDTFPDDLALIIRTEKGLVIVLGCAHRGMINTILHAQRLTGDERVHAVIGGTHLYPKSRADVENAVYALKEIGVERVGVSHCTGIEAAMLLKEALGDRFFINNSGNSVSIEA